jgi:hypothetical protein
LSVGSAAFIEEITDRFLPYSLLLIMLKRYSEKNDIYFLVKVASFLYHNLFIEHNRWFLFGWLVITSSLFSLGHGPSLSLFPNYFIGGFLYGILFLRYGYVSAVLAHFTYNVLSMPVADYFEIIVERLTK